MKKNVLFIPVIFLTAGLFAQKMTLDVASAKKSFGTAITIAPMDSTVTVTKDKITIAPKKEDVTYTISGYFNGQIVNKTKNTVLKLKDAYLENTSGAAAIYGEAKTEVSTTSGTVNYVVSSGTADAKNAAIQFKKNLVLGGSGTLTVKVDVYHAVKADDVKIKGSGAFYLQGTDKGSGLNCHSLTVEKGKTFSAYFLNSKNAVKADNTILIQSGNFYLYDNETAFKTDTKKEDPKNPHSITLSGGVFHTSGNKNFYETEKKAYKALGSKITEE